MSRTSISEVNAERVREKLRCHADAGYRAIHDLLSDLMKDPRIRAVIERRTLFTHRALIEYQSGKGKWRIVTAERRAQEYFDADGISQEVQLWSDLDAFHRHKSAEIREVVGRFEGFRHDLTKSLRRLALNVATESPKRWYAPVWRLYSETILTTWRSLRGLHL